MIHIILLFEFKWRIWYNTNRIFSSSIQKHFHFTTKQILSNTNQIHFNIPIIAKPYTFMYEPMNFHSSKRYYALIQIDLSFSLFLFYRFLLLFFLCCLFWLTHRYTTDIGQILSVAYIRSSDNVEWMCRTISLVFIKRKKKKTEQFLPHFSERLNKLITIFIYFMYLTYGSYTESPTQWGHIQSYVCICSSK